MQPDHRRHADDLREVVRLIILATTGVTDVVEAMHRQIASGPSILGKPLARPAGLFTRLAYGSVRGVTRMVGGTLDIALDKLAPLLGDSAPGPERTALLAALNGVLGDWLAATNSPLALPMTLHHERAGKRVVVLIHGSSMHEGQWHWRGHHHGEKLAQDSDWTVATVDYNSGLPVWENGKLLARALEALGEADEIAIVAHSMGGLVARAACRLAEEDGRRWRTKLRTLVTLGTPHQGSPVERVGHLFERLLPLSGYSAPLARLGAIRSAGILDLRHGLDVPLPDGVTVHAIAAEKDVLVPITSAHGPVAAERCSVVPAIDHLELLSSPEVYATIARALG